MPVEPRNPGTVNDERVTNTVIMVERVPDATLLGYETGGHLVFGHGDEIRKAVTEFVGSPGTVRQTGA